MTKVRDSAKVHLVSQPVSLVVRRRGKAQPKEQIMTVTPHPTVWNEALKLADNETRRLEVQEDGSVIILNKAKGKAPKMPKKAKAKAKKGKKS